MEPSPEVKVQATLSKGKGSFHVGETAGTHADAEHVQTAEDAVDVAEKIINQKHHDGIMFRNQTSGRLGQCLKSPRFESILSIVICLNMILIVAETDLTADGQSPPTWITGSNLTFLFIYVVECIVKIIVFRLEYFQDTWNWLDLLVVCSDSCLTFLNFFDSVERISMIRIFRLIKLSRAIRVIRQIWELKILLLGFKAAAKSIFFGMGMVLVMTCVWAILGVQLIHPVNSEIWVDSDCDRCGRAFGSTWNAFITIFQTVIAGDSWGVLAVPIIEHSWWTSTWFLNVLNCLRDGQPGILAVIVERAADARDQEVKRGILEQEETMHKSKLKLIQLCRDLDTDQNGRLSEDEFLDGFESNPAFASALLGMGVYPEDIGLLFDVLDTRGTGEVTYVSFVNILARLRTQMNQVILFSITELRKSVTELQKSTCSRDRGATPGRGSARTELSSSDGQRVAWKSSVPAPKAMEKGLENLMKLQLEEMTVDMEHRFQQMHSEILLSFSRAVQVMVESQREQMTSPHCENLLSSMWKELDFMASDLESSMNAENGAAVFDGGANMRSTVQSNRLIPQVEEATPDNPALCCQASPENAGRSRTFEPSADER
ncbi:unnamed protein product [Durusdinium trenchii]|uniref:Sodium channel protein type 10 subunit alpha n=2 Tax=Durusdinium trenchii TaxID=1381693 RepID=A0ABP0K029_9DINO